MIYYMYPNMEEGDWVEVLQRDGVIDCGYFKRWVRMDDGTTYLLMRREESGERGMQAISLFVPLVSIRRIRNRFHAARSNS